MTNRLRKFRKWKKKCWQWILNFYCRKEVSWRCSIIKFCLCMCRSHLHSYSYFPLIIAPLVIITLNSDDITYVLFLLCFLSFFCIRFIYSSNTSVTLIHVRLVCFFILSYRSSYLSILFISNSLYPITIILYFLSSCRPFRFHSFQIPYFTCIRVPWFF